MSTGRIDGASHRANRAGGAFAAPLLGTTLLLVALSACGKGESSSPGVTSPSATATPSAPEAAVEASDASTGSVEDTGAGVEDARLGDAAPDGRSEATSPRPDPYAGKPLLTTKQFQSFIFEKPIARHNGQVGYLRAGEKVVRHAEPYDGKDATQCGGTWYRVDPVGYVCEGKDGWTKNLEDPMVQAIAPYTAKDEPLPFGYGNSFGAHLYGRVPTEKEQRDIEGDVASWRKTAKGMREKLSPERRYPETALPLGPMPSFLEGHAQSPLVQPWVVKGAKLLKGPYHVHQTRLSFVAAFMVQDRPFYLTSDFFLTPADRFRAANPRGFQGFELAKKGEPGVHLPLVWVRAMPQYNHPPVFLHKVKGDVLQRTETQLPFQFGAEVHPTELSIRGQKVLELVEPPKGVSPEEGVKYVVRTMDVTRLDPSTKKPEQVKDDEVWIEVDRGKQTLVVYRGTVPLYATLVRTGAGGKTRSTPGGVFRVYQKHHTVKMSAEEKPPEEDGDEPERAYRFEDVPWVQYIYQGIALHAAFWHDSFGHPGSHGCINLSPVDARNVFKYTEPKLPLGWHGIMPGRAGVPMGSIVSVL